MRASRPAALVSATLVLATLGAACAAHGRAPELVGQPDQAASPFVDARSVVPALWVEMRYAGPDNFIGRPIRGYEAPLCLLTPEAAAALAKLDAALADQELGLRVFDCYRPQSAVDDFAAWAADPTDQAQKSLYYPNVDKADLFSLGYIAARSGHSRGSTVDMTLVDRQTGEALDMGGAYDLFDPLSASASPLPDADARAHRLLLRTAAISAGFRPYEAEWWHFTLTSEPYPDTYFDRSVGP